jgi:hypothetical protein
MIKNSCLVKEMNERKKLTLGPNNNKCHLVLSESVPGVHLWRVGGASSKAVDVTRTASL